MPAIPPPGRPPTHPIELLYRLYEENPMGFMREHGLKKTKEIITKLMTLAAEKALKMATEAVVKDLDEVPVMLQCSLDALKTLYA